MGSPVQEFYIGWQSVQLVNSYRERLQCLCLFCTVKMLYKLNFNFFTVVDPSPTPPCPRPPFLQKIYNLQVSTQQIWSTQPMGNLDQNKKKCILYSLEGEIIQSTQLGSFFSLSIFFLAYKWSVATRKGWDSCDPVSFQKFNFSCVFST